MKRIWVWSWVLVLVLVLAIAGTPALAAEQTPPPPWKVKVSNVTLTPGRTSIVSIRGLGQNLCGFFLEINYDPKVVIVTEARIPLPEGWISEKNLSAGSVLIAGASAAPFPRGILTFAFLFIEGVGPGTTSLVPKNIDLIDCTTLESNQIVNMGGFITVR